MSLLIYNFTSGTLTLPNGLATRIPSNAAGQPKYGKPWRASGAEIEGRSPEQFTALETQRLAGLTYYCWEGRPEFPTPGLLVVSPFDVPVTPPNPQVVESLTAVFDEPEEGEQGLDRSIMLIPAVPRRTRILQVFGAISRGAPDAQMYLCCHPGALGEHTPHSDKFDASQVTQFSEQASVYDRVLEEGEEVFAYCSSDYVRGNISFTYQYVD